MEYLYNAKREIINKLYGSGIIVSILYLNKNGYKSLQTGRISKITNREVTLNRDGVPIPFEAIVEVTSIKTSNIVPLRG